MHIHQQQIVRAHVQPVSFRISGRGEVDRRRRSAAAEVASGGVGQVAVIDQSSDLEEFLTRSSVHECFLFISRRRAG